MTKKKIEKKLELSELGIYFTCFYHILWNIIETHVHCILCVVAVAFALLPYFNGQIAMFVTISIFSGAFK